MLITYKHIIYFHRIILILITFYEFGYNVKDLADVKYHFEDTVVVTLYFVQDNNIGTTSWFWWVTPTNGSYTGMWFRSDINSHIKGAGRKKSEGSGRQNTNV